MVALLLSLGFLIIAGTIIGKLAGNTTKAALIAGIVVGALVALSALFFVF